MNEGVDIRAEMSESACESEHHSSADETEPETESRNLKIANSSMHQSANNRGFVEKGVTLQLADVKHPESEDNQLDIYDGQSYNETSITSDVCHRRSHSEDRLDEDDIDRAELKGITYFEPYSPSNKIASSNEWQLFMQQTDTCVGIGEDVIEYEDSLAEDNGRHLFHNDHERSMAQLSQQIPVDQYKIQNDPNPCIIRKPYNKPIPDYVQRINVKFLKPPPPPVPGPLIVKEVRPPTPPPPPPLWIRQKQPDPKTPPPIILREKPPPKPPVIPPKIICKKLPTPPPPHRQVIIERCPRLPPKPQDIIIERWLPYPSPQKRKVIYQRSKKGPSYKTPKNVVIMYEASPKIQRVFKKVGVVHADPDTYVKQHGHNLLDGKTITANARRCGIHEDISSPLMSGERRSNYHHEVSQLDYGKVKWDLESQVIPDVPQPPYDGFNNSINRDNRYTRTSSEYSERDEWWNQPPIGYDEDMNFLSRDFSAQLSTNSLLNANDLADYAGIDQQQQQPMATAKSPSSFLNQHIDSHDKHRCEF